MNYQPEVRKSLRHSDRKRTRSSYEDSSEASEDTSRNTKTRLSDQEEEEELEKKNFYKDFTCAICLETLTDPHILPDCCHRFCGGCIKESISKGNKQCPTCREHITTKRCLRKDDLVEKLLMRLQKVENQNVELKYRLEEIEREATTISQHEASVNDEPICAEFDDSKRPTRKKRKVQGIQEVEFASAIDAGRRNGSDSRNRFEERFNALKDFKLEYGHCNVPYAYSAHNNLGQWVSKVRNMKTGVTKNSGGYKLTNERIKKLDSIGFRWKAWKTFEERFNALKEFKKAHGHCNVPRAYEANDNLGNWVQTIRGMKSGKKKNRGDYKLTNERIKKLENIGFRWQTTQTFEERFNSLKEFKIAHGHCNVPQTSRANDNLGRWVSKLRNMKSGAYKNTGVHKLTNERIKKLDSIGFRWQATQIFEERFNALIEFKSEYGHCNVPNTYRAHDNLGQWVQIIRGIKSGSRENSGVYMLTKVRIKELEKIGFRWQATQTFEERFDALKEFKRKNGHCNVPYAYKADNNLGRWVQIIRNMKSGTIKNTGIYMLTKERIEKFENIGFRWKLLNRRDSKK